MWIMTTSNVLLNLNNIDTIVPKVFRDAVEVTAYYGSASYIIVSFNTAEQAERFLLRVGKEIADNHQYIIAENIAKSIERE
jgi:hypothetical protein